MHRRRPQTPRRVVSLARVLSKSGHCSRSVAVGYITEGKVRVNGTVVRDPSRRCDPATDRIMVEGINLKSKRHVYIMMHKPAGVVTTRSDERGRPTVYDVMGTGRGWIFPVGRLDKETTGLLILTNDHRLGETLTNPD